jgi:hypothetical protein
MSELPNGFVSATHAVLFVEEADRRCDVCGETVAGAGEDDEEGYGVKGCGLLVWTRGEERRYQERPLCPACAAAVGVSALSRWEIEEDEG